jgi:putative hydrolase of HD superfamily
MLLDALIVNLNSNQKKIFQNTLIEFMTDQDSLKATQDDSNLDEFFKTVIKLKTVHRQGWKNKLGLQNPESVADHCYSMTVMAMILSDIKKLDTAKIIKMSLLHDLAETVTGDLTPDDVSKTKKRELENLAMKNILQNLSESLRTHYFDLWDEYQKNSTAEAQLLHQIDKLEMAVQASEYMKTGFAKNSFSSFFDSAKTVISDPDLQKLLAKFM